MDIIQSFSDRNLGRYTLDNKYTRHLQDVSPIPLDGGYIVRNNIQDVPKTEELSEAELINMDTDRGKLWAAASKVIYDSMYDGVNALTIKEPESEQDYGRFGVEFMGQFDHNMSMMGYNVAKLQGVDERTKLAMHHMMTEFGQLPMFSWNGAYRVTKGMFTDPTTYASLGTLGLGFLGRAGVKQTTKQGFKEMLRRGITNPYAIAALEGGAYTGMYDYLTQEVNIEAGVQDDVNLGQLATATGTGMVAGPAIVGAGELAVKGAKKLMPGQGDLFDEPTPTSGAPLSAENLEASAVQKFAFYKNKEGGQEVGNKQIIVDIDENIFENHVRPLLDKGMTYEEFEMGKMPGGLYENMHAAFTSVNGGDYKLTKVDDLNNLQPDQTYAIQVDDFNSPDAVTRRQTADSDVIPLGDNIAKFEPPTDDKPGIVAFHGSGADFDEFSLEKIGTGEGAQVYGYGLYFTDAEDIAKFYRDSVGGANVLKRAEDIKIANPDGGQETAANFTGFRNKFAEYYGDNAALFADRYLGQFTIDPDASEDVLIQRAVDTMNKVQESDKIPDNPKEIVSKITLPDRGKIYKVGLSPKVDDLLDYDVDLADQDNFKKEAVLRAVKRAIELSKDPNINNSNDYDPDMQPTIAALLGDESSGVTNMNIAGLLSDMQDLTNKEIPAKLLREEGIPGIRYATNDTRGKQFQIFLDVRGKPYRETEPIFARNLDEAKQIEAEYKEKGFGVEIKDARKNNYVIFDDKAIKILEKYGVAGPVAVTALASQQTQDDDARVANAPKI